MSRPVLLPELLRRAAVRDRGAAAVHDGPVTTTYGELDRLADACAAALATAGVRPGDRVLVWAEKSAETIAVLLGALRAGAIYVPVSPANPVHRVARIAADCTARLVVGDRPAELPTGQVLGFADLLALGGTPVEHPARPGDPAYILYTSGSTGTPKGVCLSHRNALAFVEWAVGETRLGPDDRLASHAPFNFDLSVFDLYGALSVGASVDLLDSATAYSPPGLVEFLLGRPVTTWYSVPSALGLMIREGGLLGAPPPAWLRTCVFAGEPFPLTEVLRLRRAWPGVRLLNWYGPTETNVCTSYEVTDADLDRTTALPIGRACSGDTVEVDAAGEIVVTGPTVMLGYWGRPAHHGPYRTGDLGYYDEHGQLVCSGRRDAMVKLRGHRVELGEVEVVVGSHPAVAAAVVVVTGDGLDARLHAFAVAEPGTRPTLLELKRLCAQRLPHYMIVDRLTVVDRLPRTANGKTDRAALLAAAGG